VVCGAVFDGHGGFNGMLASAHCRDSTLAMLHRLEDEFDSWSAAQWSTHLSEHFDHLHTTLRELLIKPPQEMPGSVSSGSRYADGKGVVRQANGDPVHGGSTGSVVVFVENLQGDRFLVSANVGDSDVILVNPKHTDWRRFSEDHGPDSSTEWQRVKDLDPAQYPSKLHFVYDKNNVFKKYTCPLVFRPDGTRDQVFVDNPWGMGLHPTNVRYDPAVYAVTGPEVTRDTTCIAMTRSLGDFYAHPFGLTHLPSVEIFPLPKQTNATSPLFVVVATDGIWDCWRYELFADHVLTATRDIAAGQSLQAVTTSSVELTIKKAIESFGARHYDDASFVLIRIPEPLHSSSASTRPSSIASPKPAAEASKSDATAALPIRRTITIQGADGGQ
jgi:serine/threonine protein phosphatase PrpC